jgi:type IV secretion system protein VirB1
MTGVSALIVACGILRQVDLLAAIVRAESGGNPIALAVNGAVELVRAPRDPADAVAMARWLAAHGYNFDAGLAQVNSANFARLGLDASSAFDPCQNLRAALVVLDECSERARARGLVGAQAWAAALSCYNTGDLSRGIRNGYAAAVLESSPRAGRARTSASVRRSPASLAFPGADRRPDVFSLPAAPVRIGGETIRPPRPYQSPRSRRNR